MNDALDRLVDALREERAAPIPASSRDRVAARLASLMPGLPTPAPASVPAPTHGAPGTAGAIGSGVARAGLKGFRPLVAFSLAVGGFAGAALHARLSPTEPPRVVYVPMPVVVPAPAEPTNSWSLVPGAGSSNLTASPPAGFAPAASTTANPYPPASGSSMSRSSPQAQSGSPAQLDAERALLDEVRSELARGNPERAIEALARHDHTFARPILGEEREALTVEVLVRAGRYAEARVRADAFLRSHPGSLFQSVVESAIASIP